MPNTDCLTYLKAILSKDIEAARYQAGKDQPERPPIVITISRDYGAGGELIGTELSHYLGIPLYDREILRLIAERSKTSEWHVEPHDEQVTSGLTSFIFSTITGTNAHAALYRRYLYDVVSDLAKKDGILIGRGAHLVLRHQPIFRVRVIASPETCAERIAEDEGVDIEAATKRVKDINAKRHQSIQTLFSDIDKKCSLENAHNFDLVINTDQIAPEDAVPLVLIGLRQAGFCIHENHAKTRA